MNADYKWILKKLESLKGSTLPSAEDGAAIDEAMDIITDYEAVTKQLSMMFIKYEAEKAPISRGIGIYQCPDCRAATRPGNAHCWQCGRKLDWDIRPKTVNHMRKKRKR